MTDDDPIDIAALTALCQAHEQRPIPGYPGYVATTKGEIWSLNPKWTKRSGRLLRPQKNKDGYYKVRVYRSGIRVNVSVHRLVARAFHGLPSPGQHTRHLDGTRTNNAPSNLAWGSAKDNAEDRIRHGRTFCGDRSPTRRHPESVARGNRHGTHTHPESVARGDRSGSRRHPEKRPRGELAAKSALKNADIVAIRASVLSGVTTQELAAKYGLHIRSIQRIVRRKSWSHVA